MSNEQIEEIAEDLDVPVSVIRHLSKAYTEDEIYNQCWLYYTQKRLALEAKGDGLTWDQADACAKRQMAEAAERHAKGSDNVEKFRHGFLVWA